MTTEGLSGEDLRTWTRRALSLPRGQATGIAMLFALDVDVTTLIVTVDPDVVAATLRTTRRTYRRDLVHLVDAGMIEPLGHHAYRLVLR